MLPANHVAAAPELAAYLADSFGNAIRIDYGTGHETTFVAFLYCLVSTPSHSLTLRALRFVRSSQWTNNPQRSSRRRER